MMSRHCVCVWEWFDESACVWRAYSPPVSKQLERANVKHLTRVVLSDAEPELDAYVNLRTRTQCLDTPDGVIECGVRRSLYSVNSAAGRGSRWEWARANRQQPAHLAAEATWQVLPMEIQCKLEDSWIVGESIVDLSVEATLACPWQMDLKKMTALGPGGAVKLIRRLQQPPYPMVKNSNVAEPERDTIQDRRHIGSIPQQHTGSSTKSMTSEYSMASTNSTVHSNSKCTSGKHNLVRILNNLNIFGNHKHSPPVQQECEPPDQLSAQMTCEQQQQQLQTNRRPSVDTVSTYLSHESKESLTQPPINDLLNCSIGSDEVFDTPKPKEDMGSIVSVDAAWRSVSTMVRVMSTQNGGRCCGCGGPLSTSVAVTLTLCRHYMHLTCLNALLNTRPKNTKYISCPNCGTVYGDRVKKPGDEVSVGPDGGTMSWCVQHRSLPAHNTNTLCVTYNMVSGTQSNEHPAPGRPYYAVGFPRVTYLPDTPLGRKVLNLLWTAWERRLLFTIERSQTTGREYVVTWRKGLEQRTERCMYSYGIEDSNRYLHTIIDNLIALGVNDDTQHLYQELT